MSKQEEHAAQWLMDARWGVWCHYLTNEQSPDKSKTSSDDWNRLVDGFDVEALADQLAGAEVPYFFFTIGQGSGHYCAPNEAYDAITGIRPSKCSRRDLMGDLADALIARNIRLIAYAPSDGPWDDPVASAAFEYERPPWDTRHGPGKPEYRLAAFQQKWERVLREWSKRWGDRVSGWWLDGCYFANDMYQHPEAPNFTSFAAALRAGNPESLIAFNYGPEDFEPVCPEEDFTAGESHYRWLAVGPGLPGDWKNQFMRGRWVENKTGDYKVQLHVSSYLGSFWCQSPPRFENDFACAYTRHVNAHGGAMTWDVPIGPTGAIPEAFTDQLQAIGKAMGNV